MAWHGRDDLRWVTAALLITALVLGLGLMLRAAGLGAAANVAQLVSLAPLIVGLANWTRPRQSTTHSPHSIVAYATLADILADHELRLGEVQPTAEAVRNEIDNRLRDMRLDAVDDKSDSYMRLVAARVAIGKIDSNKRASRESVTAPETGLGRMLAMIKGPRRDSPTRPAAEELMRARRSLWAAKASQDFRNYRVFPLMGVGALTAIILEAMLAFSVYQPPAIITTSAERVAAAQASMNSAVNNMVTGFGLIVVILLALIVLFITRIVQSLDEETLLRLFDPDIQAIALKRVGLDRSFTRTEFRDSLVLTADEQPPVQWSFIMRHWLSYDETRISPERANGDAGQAAPGADAGQAAPGADAGQAAPGADAGQAAPGADAGQAAPGADAGQAAPGADAGQAAPGADAGQAAPGADAGQAAPGADAGQAAPGADAGQAAPGADAGQAAPGADAGQAAPGADAGQAAPGADAGQAAPGADAGQAAPGADFLAEDQYNALPVIRQFLRIGRILTTVDIAGAVEEAAELAIMRFAEMDLLDSKQELGAAKYKVKRTVCT